jgi:ketosteroid isomerase-like protein
MKRLIMPMVLLLFSCSEIHPTNKEAELKIKKLMSEQQAAWNNGDLEEFMQPYQKNDELKFVGKSGLNKGWQTTLDNYKKSYPDKEKMGTLLFENLEFEPLGTVHFLVIGKWNLFRKSDTLSGHYSLVWEKQEHGWKIIADHSS